MLTSLVAIYSKHLASPKNPWGVETRSRVGESATIRVTSICEQDLGLNGTILKGDRDGVKQR